MEFKDRLKEIRKERGKTQQEIVSILGCSLNKYASWEQGRTEPDIECIKQLCQIFEVSADDLLGLNDY